MSASAGALTLSELLARNVRVEPWEAVAIVRSVIEQLCQTGAESSIPELHEIQLAPDGQVDVTGGVRTAEPIRRLGQMLQALLALSAPPVQLRLLISEATGPEPPYTSIEHYGRELGYFERPDWDSNIRALYARAAEASEPPVGALLPTIDGMAPLRSKEHAEDRNRAASLWGRRVAKVLVAAGVIAFLCIGTIVVVRNLPSTNRTDRVTRVVTKASDAVGSALLTGASAVTERVGLGRLVSQSHAADVAPATRPTLTIRSKVTRPVRYGARVSPSTSLVAFDLEALPTSETVAPPVTESLALVHSSVVIPAGTAALDTQIYTPQSHGVNPPVSVRPQLPRRLPDSVTMDDLGQIELIILENGTVESVRLLGTQHTVSEAMMLSAAKTWQFKPALRDGHPVKYRKVLWMARY